MDPYRSKTSSVILAYVIGPNRVLIIPTDDQELIHVEGAGALEDQANVVWVSFVSEVLPVELVV
jgi:hypothetical protein